MKPLPPPSPKEKYNAQDGVEGDRVVEHVEQSFPLQASAETCEAADGANEHSFAEHAESN
jgi:hypothetical protein